MWAHFIAVSSAVLAVAIIVGVLQWVHPQVASRLYASTMLTHSDGSAPGAVFGAPAVPGPAVIPSADFSTGAGKENSDFLIALGREGARWARNSHFEATVWASVILAIVVLVLLYHFWQTGGSKMYRR